MLASGIKILSEDDLQRIHDAAVKVLQQRGVWVEDEKLRQQLKQRGAGDGLETGEVRLPRELVAECLQSAGRRPVRRCINGKTLEIHSCNRYYGSLVTDPYILEYPRKLRRPRLDDIARHARLGDALPLIDCTHLMDDTIPDLDSTTSVLKGLLAFVSNTTTSYHCAPGSLESTRYWIEIAEIMAGGSLKQNPILGVYAPTISPLTLAELNTQQLRMYIDHGVSFHLGPCAIGGATAPYTVAGLVTQSWAEFLAPLVVSQVIQPGTPVIGGGGGAHPMDMTTGASLYSGITKYLCSGAMNELCQWFDLPTSTGNYSTLCANFGVQNGLESMMGMFACFFGRCNLAGGMGSLANACGMSPVQIVLHHDVAEMLERFSRGIDLSDEKLAVESIISVGPRGNFLEDPLTLKYLRTDENFYAPCYERCVGGQDVKDMALRGHERAEDLIASHKPAVPEDRVEEVRKYVERQLAAAGR